MTLALYLFFGLKVLGYFYACAIGIWVFYLLLRVGFYGIFTSFFEVRERFLKLTIKKEDQHGKR